MAGKVLCIIAIILSLFFGLIVGYSIVSTSHTITKVEKVSVTPSIITSTVYTTSINYLTMTSTTTSTAYTTATITITSTQAKGITTTSTVYTVKTITTTTARALFGIEGAEVDLVATVYKVIDGDTFDAFPSGRVRLADINAREIDQPGGLEAKNALTILVLNKQVYLDVDDTYTMDKYNRLICLVFIDYNSTHLLNVNKWLVENGYAEISDYPNEFNPRTWTLYAKKT